MQHLAYAVLFVDDESTILSSLKRVMRSEPYPCLYAEGGQQAIDILSARPVAVLVTDMHMPEMDGPQLLKYVALHHPATIRLVLSSWTESEEMLSAINSGSICRYIVKPWDNRELKAAVRQSMELYTLQFEKERLLEQLEVQNEKLEQQVVSRTRQLLKISNHAEIGKHAAQIVHNLKSPLQVMFGALGMVRTMLKKRNAIDKAELTKYIQIADQGSKNLQQIVAGILMHARDNKHQRVMPMDINAIILQELDFFDIDPEFKMNIEKQVELDEHLPSVFGNSIQIKQILDNLIRNAIDAMEAQSIKKLRICTTHDHRSVILEISDTGEGITEEDLPLIFNPDFSTKPMEKGTGLGLASVQAMVTAYGGKIKVQSQKGQGATFTLNFPINYKNSAGSYIQD